MVEDKPSTLIEEAVASAADHLYKLLAGRFYRHRRGKRKVIINDVNTLMYVGNIRSMQTSMLDAMQWQLQCPRYHEGT